MGGAELRWPLSKVRRGHRLDDFSSLTPASHPFDQTAGVPVTRRARGSPELCPRATCRIVPRAAFSWVLFTRIVVHGIHGNKLESLYLSKANRLLHVSYITVGAHIVLTTL